MQDNNFVCDNEVQISIRNTTVGYNKGQRDNAAVMAYHCISGPLPMSGPTLLMSGDR